MYIIRPNKLCVHVYPQIENIILQDGDGDCEVDCDDYYNDDDNNDKDGNNNGNTYPSEQHFFLIWKWKGS